MRHLFSDKESQQSICGFVECCSPQQARRLLDNIEEQNLEVGGHDGVKPSWLWLTLTKTVIGSYSQPMIELRHVPQAEGKTVSI